MRGWEHFAVPGFVEKVVLTARIRAYVIFTAASVWFIPRQVRCSTDAGGGACLDGAEALKSGRRPTCSDTNPEGTLAE